MAEFLKLFVGGLPYALDEDGLRAAFDQFGEIIHCKIVREQESGRSRGFGFVEFLRSESAKVALSVMDGQDIQGRVCNVSVARDRPGYGRYGKMHQDPSAGVEFLRKRRDDTGLTSVHMRKERPARRRKDRRENQ